jgi:hypothetical protein
MSIHFKDEVGCLERVKFEKPVELGVRVEDRGMIYRLRGKEDLWIEMGKVAGIDDIPRHFQLSSYFWGIFFRTLKDLDSNL